MRQSLQAMCARVYVTRRMPSKAHASSLALDKAPWVCSHTSTCGARGPGRGGHLQEGLHVPVFNIRVGHAEPEALVGCDEHFKYSLSRP